MCPTDHDDGAFAIALLVDDTEETTLLVEDAELDRMAIESRSDEGTPPPQSPPLPPIIFSVEYERALGNVRLALIEDFSMPPQIVDLYLSQARARGVRR